MKIFPEIFPEIYFYKFAEIYFGNLFWYASIVLEGTIEKCNEIDKTMLYVSNPLL